MKIEILVPIHNLAQKIAMENQRSRNICALTLSIPHEIVVNVANIECFIRAIGNPGPVEQVLR